MGKVEHTVTDKLVSPEADRNSNRLRVYRKENGEVVVHFRNFKLMLFPGEVAEWRDGFAQALKKLKEKDYMKNDI